MLGWSLYSIKIWSFIHDTLNGRYFYLISVTSGLCICNWFMIIKYIVIQIQNLKTVHIDLLEIKALYFFVCMVTSLFLWFTDPPSFFFCFFFLKIEKKKNFTDFLFLFCPPTLRYFLNFKTRSPRTTSVCFLYINLNDEYTKQT